MSGKIRPTKKLPSREEIVKAKKIAKSIVDKYADLLLPIEERYIELENMITTALEEK